MTRSTITPPATPTELLAAGAPTVAETAVALCEVCGSSRYEPYAFGYDYELGTCANRWRFVCCADCTHVWLDPRPSVEALDVIYPTSYYAYNYDTISPLARKGKETLDGLKIKRILRRCARPPLHYLDVGCGDGRYLEALGRLGVPGDGLYGLELDEDTVERLRERGLHAFCERVETCERFEAGSFDLITVFHVIEHVESPRAVIERLASWLAPGGTVAIETPNLDSLDARMFGDGTWGGWHIPRHWHMFRPATLLRLIEAAGLEVQAVHYETGHAFWMYSLHHRLRYGIHPHPRLAKFFDPFSSVLPLVAFTAFDKARAALGAKTSAMLVTARKPG